MLLYGDSVCVSTTLYVIPSVPLIVKWLIADVVVSESKLIVGCGLACVSCVSSERKFPSGEKKTPLKNTDSCATRDPGGLKMVCDAGEVDPKPTIRIDRYSNRSVNVRRNRTISNQRRNLLPRQQPAIFQRFNHFALPALLHKLARQRRRFALQAPDEIHRQRAFPRFAHTTRDRTEHISTLPFWLELEDAHAQRPTLPFVSTDPPGHDDNPEHIFFS